jgi:prefoldin subunit 5
MKKILLGLVIIALTVVGCQNYDDQFDSLNDKIAALSSEVSSLQTIQANVTALGTKVDALAGSALTDEDLATILKEITDLEAEIDGLDGVIDEVDDLNNEVDQILEKLNDLLSANAFYEGNLVIKNLGQLANAHEMIKTGADDPTITVKGNVDVVVGANGVTKDSIASVQLILSKIRSVQGTATLTTDSDANMDALTYVTGNVDLNGTDGKANISAAKLLTIDGNMTITGLTGAVALPTLGSVQGVRITEIAGKATVTSVDFSGMTAGKVETSPGELVLAGATSVKLGGELPAVVTLAKCTEFVHGGAVAQPALDLTLGGANATMSLAATSFTGEVTITTKGNINLPSVKKIVKTQLIAQTDASEAHLPSLEEVAGPLDISAKFTTIDLTALKTATASMAIHGVVVVSLPELAVKAGQVTAMIACPAATTFSAPKLDTASRVIDLKAAVDHISLLNLNDVATPTNEIVEWAAIKKIELAAQKGDLDVSAATALVDLIFTGFKNTPTGEDAQLNTLTITGANTVLKTLTIGATSALKTLNVTTTVLKTLSTAGEIINCNVSNNSSLETFNFAHTHLQGDRESKVDITNNDKVLSVDMSSLSKVGTVTVTGNAKLATLVAPSTDVLATSLAPIDVHISANDLSGTYTAATAPTGTVTYVAPVITSAALSSFKAWLQANKDVDIANPIGTKDRTHAAAGHADYATGSGVTANPVTYNMDIDNVDVVGTDAVEVGNLSTLMNADAAAKAGATGAAADNDGDNTGGVTTARELATIAD